MQNTGLDIDFRRVPKQQRARDKYNAIIEASIVVLAREGYVGTNTSKIAKQAGVAVGSLYEYFPNKESIFTAYLDSRVETILALLKQAADDAKKQLEQEGEQDLREKLKSWLHLAFEASFQNKELIRTLLGEIPGALDLDSIKNLEAELLPLAKFLTQKKEMTEQQLNTKTYILTNVLYGFIIRSVFSESPISTEQLADEMLKLIVAYSEQN